MIFNITLEFNKVAKGNLGGGTCILKYLSPPYLLRIPPHSTTVKPFLIGVVIFGLSILWISFNGLNKKSILIQVSGFRFND